LDKKRKLIEIRKKISNNIPSIGSWMQIPSTSLAEIFGDAGYDWIAVDLEHGSISVSQLPDIFRALEINNTLPLVRIAQGKLKDAKSALDAGAGGIIVPMIKSATELKEIIDYSCWPPVGKRGVGFSRANMFGKYFDPNDEVSLKPLIIAQIENIEAVDQIDEILQTEGLDSIIIGPYDLSASMGITGEFSNSEFVDTTKKILNSCSVNNIPCGFHIINPNKEELSMRIKDGYLFIAYSIDGIMFSKISRNPNSKF
jgi:2-dehydro-3-deoxyglucarate aldolase